MRPGLYAMSAGDYHADPNDAPSLSASIAHRLLAQSPRHAWTAHPRLNPAHEPEHAEAFDLGTAAHAYLLEGQANVVVIDAKDYRSKAAQESRDLARAAGRVPILASRWDDVLSMAAAARVQLGHHPEPVPLLVGLPEQTLIWREGDIWCRARLDWLADDRRVVDDYKTTEGSAHPEAWCRGPLFRNGYDVQAAFYLRGVKVLFGIDASFRFVVQECYPPFALSVIGLGPDVLTLGEKKRLRAVELWQECLETGIWPAYPARTHRAELPPWEEASWMAREERELVEMERTNR